MALNVDTKISLNIKIGIKIKTETHTYIDLVSLYIYMLIVHADGEAFLPSNFSLSFLFIQQNHTRTYYISNI
jgi:hypothetical protein